MDTRRNVLRGMAAGAAACSLSGGTAIAAGSSLKGRDGLLEGRDGFLGDGAAPWWLIAPLTVGSTLAYGWYVGGLGRVTRGASVLTLKHSSGREVRVHLCGYESEPRGVAHTGLIDLVLMDGGSGNEQTDEAIGRIVLGVANKIAVNEISSNEGLAAVSNMLPHDQRKALYGAETL
jgi:hypothetical protein